VNGENERMKKKRAWRKANLRAIYRGASPSCNFLDEVEVPCRAASANRPKADS
jgi:hypothetical protein